MKIDLKLSPDQVFAIAKLLETVYTSSPTNKTQKVIASIARDVADKYIKKQHALYSSQTLFDKDKKHKISLKYHEAFALHDVIDDLLHTINDHYSQTIVKKVLATLNQKLA